jgi:hypothetical protein
MSAYGTKRTCTNDRAVFNENAKFVNVSGGSKLQSFKETTMTKVFVWVVAIGVGLMPAMAQARSGGPRNVAAQSTASQKQLPGATIPGKVVLKRSRAVTIKSHKLTPEKVEAHSENIRRVK